MGSIWVEVSKSSLVASYILVHKMVMEIFSGSQECEEYHCTLDVLYLLMWMQVQMSSFSGGI
jgi:hypothetical protein